MFFVLGVGSIGQSTRFVPISINFEMFYVYIIPSRKNGAYYIGFTQNIDLRLVAHNKSMVRSTKNKRPWSLVYQEAYETRSEVVKRERYLKSLKKRVYLENLIKQF